MDDPRRRAFEYLRRKGTDAPVAELAAGFAAALRGLEALLAPVSESRARLRPAQGGWSVQEVVDHLILSHRPAIAQLQAASRGADPGPPIPAHVISADPFAVAFPTHVAELTRIHDGLIALVSAFPEIPPPTHIPIAMVLKVEREGEMTRLEYTEQLDVKAYAQALRVHTLEHHRQIERILAG